MANIDKIFRRDSHYFTVPAIIHDLFRMAFDTESGIIM